MTDRRGTMSIPDPHEFFEDRIRDRTPSREDYQRLVDLLWEHYGESVFLYAYAKLSATEDARDVCQDAFVNAMEWLEGHPGEMPLKLHFPAWLRRIARNLIIDRFRRPAIERPWPHAASREESEAAAYADWPDPGQTAPLEELAHHEELDALRQCIGQLREKKRQMVVLCDLEGLSYADISEQLGVPMGTVGGTLHRARRDLRDCVELRLAAATETE